MSVNFTQNTNINYSTCNMEVENPKKEQRKISKSVSFNDIVKIESIEKIGTKVHPRPLTRRLITIDESIPSEEEQLKRLQEQHQLSLFKYEWTTSDAGEEHENEFPSSSFSSSSSLSTTTKKQNDSYIPEELKELLQKLESLNSFKDFNMSDIYQEYQSCRDIVIGSNKEGNKIFIKSTTGKRMRINAQYSKRDQLAYMISHRLNLGVVPPTMACEGYQNILGRSSIAKKLHDCEGVVIQEGVPLHSNQFHMDKNSLISEEECYKIKAKFSEKDAEKVINENCNRVISKLSLKVNDICRTAIFNIIVGRRDADRRNSVVDTNGNIKEIDNENIGSTKTSSWLFDVFSECILDRKLIDNILTIEDSQLDNIFKDLKCFGPAFLWNVDTCELDTPDLTNGIIKSNLKKLKYVLSKNKETNIKLDYLKKYFYYC